MIGVLSEKGFVVAWSFPGPAVGGQRDLQRSGSKRASFMRQRLRRGSQIGRPRDHNRTARTHRMNHHRRCPRTRRGPPCMRGIFQRSSSTCDAAQAASEMKTTHYRRQIPHLRMQGTIFGPIFWTVDGRPTDVSSSPQTPMKT